MKTPPSNLRTSEALDAAAPAATDHALVERIARGDDAAIRALMNRYDRLIRFAIFRLGRDRCRKDPAWLETIASDTWIGFLQSVRRSGKVPEAPAAYLLRIARNKAISATRTASRRGVSVELDGQDGPDEEAPCADPAELVSSLEELTSLQACVELLGADDRELVTQLSVLMERRWRDAATALNLPESTVRSRWKRVLDRLRTCLEGKIGRKLAPPPPSGDE